MREACEGGQQAHRWPAVIMTGAPDPAQHSRSNSKGLGDRRSKISLHQRATVAVPSRFQHLGPIDAAAHILTNNRSASSVHVTQPASSGTAAYLQPACTCTCASSRFANAQKCSQ